MANKHEPAFTAYTVSKRGDYKDDWWTPIGAAFEHSDQKGYNIVLQTIPLDGKIILRPPKDKDENAQSGRNEQHGDPRPRENASRNRRDR
jgi:hypothetical protein